MSYGANTCAFAAAVARTSPADITHPVNSFIIRSPTDAPRGSISLLYRAQEHHRRIRRSLGRIAARLLQIGGDCRPSSAVPARNANRRLSRACVIEKNLAWSELGQQSCLIAEQCLHRDCDENSALRPPRSCRQGRSSGTLSAGSEF